MHSAYITPNQLLNL